MSTDKAVAPATVMGASKALAEFALEAASGAVAEHPLRAVRFGNVLGSSGSVVPIFRRQIARGGPVTVTDERMTRYFMTIPEAVQLIIRSGSLSVQTHRDQQRLGVDARSDGNGLRPAAALADVYVLEMGEPVPIIELAREMISLSGLRPRPRHRDRVVGRRPGEKLNEELFNSYERSRNTAAEKILLAEREPLGGEQVEAMFEEIGLLVLEGDAAGLAAKVSQLSTDLLEAQTSGGWPASRRVRSRRARAPSDEDNSARAGGEIAPHAHSDSPLPDAPPALIHSPDS